MGKGDRKSKKGKRFMGSYGKRRQRSRVQTEFLPDQQQAKTKKEPMAEAVADEPKTKKAAPKAAAKKAPAKKAPTKKSEAKADTVESKAPKAEVKAEKPADDKAEKSAE